jgi:hypothetical protein
MCAMRDLLVQAIDGRRVIAFRYKGGAQRTAEPHDYGVSRGHDRLLVDQLSGASASGASHGWKDLLVADIRDLVVLDRTFAGSRGHETRQHREWDTLFARVE